MVDKKGLKAVNRNEIILIILALVFVGFVFAVGTATLDSPVNYGNYSTTMNFSCTNVSVAGAANATLYYNKSGGAAATFFQDLDIGNLSGAAFENASVYIGNLDESSTYNFTCVVANNTDLAYSSVHNVTIDRTAPRVTDFFNTLDGAYYNGTTLANTFLMLNVTVNDSSWNGYRVDPMRGVDNVSFNITNSAGTQVNFTQAYNQSGLSSGNYWNATWNISDTDFFPDGVYTITVWANETQGNEESYFASHENKSESINITIDNVAPTIAYTCSPSSAYVGSIVTCTCTGTDATSGVNYTSDTTTTSSTSQIVTEITAAAAGTFTKTCTVKDRTGHRASTTASYTILSVVTDGGNGGGVSSTSGTTISEASSVILSGFEEETSVEQIEVTVNAAVSNAKIIVTRYESQPTGVSVAKSGFVYKYIQVEAENFGDKLESAVMKVKIEKDWVSSNNLEKEDVAVFRYDENAAEKWDELITTFKEEDAGYYYYDVELDSFSYFAIGESALVEGEEEGEEESEGNLLWLWIVIGIVVVAVIIGGGIAVKKKK